LAQRITPTGKKDYVFQRYIQAFYTAEYLFTVDASVFIPRPKVQSGVIRLTRKENFSLGCDEQKFLTSSKAASGQRRKHCAMALEIAGR